MIPFNKPLLTGQENKYIEDVFARLKFAGNGKYAHLCQNLLSSITSCSNVSLTTSGSHALEVAARLCNLKPGDEIIVPSFGFPTTASSFLSFGVELVFVDVDAKTMNISTRAVRDAINRRTKAIVALHYAGVACDMEVLRKLAKEHEVLLIEDAAHALHSSYMGAPLGSIGDFACISFHQSKNVHCGEGGAFLCNRDSFQGEAEMIIEKGTNRQSFNRGEVDKYTWITHGSSYVLSEINAAFLFAQLQKLKTVTKFRLSVWDDYQARLKELESLGLVSCPTIPTACEHNGHMYWLKVENEKHRNGLIEHLTRRGIQSVFHYQPLHKSPAGLKLGRFVGEDVNTTAGANTLLRLPLFFGFNEQEKVIAAIFEYFDAPFQ